MIDLPSTSNKDVLCLDLMCFVYPYTYIYSTTQPMCMRCKGDCVLIIELTISYTLTLAIWIQGEQSYRECYLDS